MKNILTFSFLILLSFLSQSCDQRSEKAKLAHEVVLNVSKTLNARYQLHYFGIAEEADQKYYKLIGISFKIFHSISKEEGRKMLIESADEFLKTINSNQDLLPYLMPSPFTINNVEIAIYVYHPDHKDVFYPDIVVFSIRSGKLKYKTQIPEKKYGFYTVEEESYEEALKIIQSQSQTI